MIHTDINIILIYNKELLGIQLGYQGRNIWYPKLNSGIIRILVRIPQISNPDCTSQIERIDIHNLYIS